LTIDDLEVAKRHGPNSLRTLNARSTTENFAHGSDSPTSADRELGIIFGPRIARVGVELAATTGAVVQPQAVRSGIAEGIVGEIVTGGFRITGAVMTRRRSSEGLSRTRDGLQ
jgi:nucleoside-diphosphate kinase